MRQRSVGLASNRRIVPWLLFLLMLVMAGLVQGAGSYNISWYTINGGGGTSSSGPYVLAGTVGQPDAGWCSGGSYELLGGFWPGGPQKMYTGPHFDQWLAVGAPACWCANINPRQCHGDADGKCQGKKKYWVSVNDLDILIAAWNKPFEEIEGRTQNGIPCIAADFDHLPEGKQKYRVSTNDLDILIRNWHVANSPDPNCP